MLPEGTIRTVAAGAFAFAVASWALVSRWERPWKSTPLRAKHEGAPRSIGLGGDVSQLVILFYPGIVAALPSLSYGTVLQWSFPFDEIAQVAGIGVWAVGAATMLWSFRVLARYLSVNGVAVDHELVTSGPYSRVRHPVYGAFMFLAFGLALAFESYVLLPFVALTVASGWYWAREEERLLASSAGFGETYRAYMRRTGRFLPRM